MTDASPFAPWAAARPPDPCTATLLGPDGTLLTAGGQMLASLSQHLVYLASCPPARAPLAPRTVNPDVRDLLGNDTRGGPQFSDFRDPFYASTFVVSYALAAATITAYMLVIMLFITPRTFVNGGVAYLGRRSRFSSTASSSAVDVGGRPWLQKVAALSVAISLTAATGITFKVAARQYHWGVQNARDLQADVMGTVALRVIRLVSDTFLWLAQAQTLIRLFQRQREKIIIKWAAFALITLDVLFNALNSFHATNSGSQGNMRPRTFADAIPALSYLFQLSLGLLYAAWVVYYSILKKRYAFYHPLMKNMPLVAMISLFAIMIPTIFFIIDISKPEFTVWGDYVRWVGAAAASVVVWEWVERIEALEREEKKGGILGRQVFDGEDMLEAMAPSDASWSRSRFRKEESDGGWTSGGTGDLSVVAGPGLLYGRAGIMASMANGRYRYGSPGFAGDSTDEVGGPGPYGEPPLRPPTWPQHPATAVTPVSRTDTGSAASTVYTVRYQNPSESTRRTPDVVAPSPTSTPATVSTAANNHSTSSNAHNLTHHTTHNMTHNNIALTSNTNNNTNAISRSPSNGSEMNHAAAVSEGSEGPHANRHPTPTTSPTAVRPQYSRRSADVEAREPDESSRGWPQRLIPSLFRRNPPEEPPAEVLPHPPLPTRASPPPPPPPQRQHRDDPGRWDLRARIEDFTATRAERLREKIRPPADADGAMRVMVIPAPPRRGAALEQLLEEEERLSGDLARLGRQHSSGSTGPSAEGWAGRRSRSGSYSELQRDPNFVAPPMWPGVYPVEYEESLVGSTDSEGPSRTGSARSRRSRPR